MASITYHYLTISIVLLELSDGQYINSTGHITAKANAISDFLTYCSVIDTCTIRRTDVPLAPPSCHECSCTDQCGYDCCPDGPQAFMSEQEILMLKRLDTVRCTEPSIKRDIISNSWPSYEMTIGCPYGYNNSTIIDKCLLPFKKFHLGNHVWNVPVTINSTNMTYKNVYCAACNGAPIEESVFWDVILQCSINHIGGRINALDISHVTTVADIPDNLQDQCNVLFRVPDRFEDQPPATKCPGIIDRCNVTGEWKGGPAHTDYYIESACLSYKSEYRGYRNVHCFLCNGGDLNNNCCPLYPAPVVSTTVLSIRNGIGTTEQACEFGSIFDELKQTCRKLHCSQGFVFDGVRCVAFLQYQSQNFVYHVYDVTLAFEPEKSSLANIVSASSMMEVFTVVIDEVLSKLNEIKGAHNVGICDTLRFIKFKQSANDLLGTLQSESRDVLFYDVMYIAFTFRVSLSGVGNVTQAVQDLLTLYNGTFIEVNGASYTSGSRILKQGLINAIYQPRNDTVDELDEDLVRSLGLIEFMEQTLVFSHTDPSDGFVIARLAGSLISLDCESVATVDVDVFCPKVELTHDDFVKEDNGVRIKGINRLVPRSDGHFGSGWNTFRICSELYMEIVQKGLESVTSSVTITTGSSVHAYTFHMVVLVLILFSH